PAPLRRAFANALHAVPGGAAGGSTLARGRAWAEGAAASRELRYARRMMHFPPELKRRLCVGELAAVAARHESSRLLLDAFAASDASDFIDAMLDVDVNHYLPDCLLVKVDIASMAHGLEARS